MGIVSKCCVRCGEDKPAGEFSAHRGNRDGLHSYCKTCFASYMRERRQGSKAIRDKDRIAAAAWKAANPERARAGYNSPEKRAKDKAFMQTAEGKDRRRIVEQNRRARKKQSGGSFSFEEWQEVLADFNYRCGYCLTDVGPFEMDHIHPICLGGRHSRENIAPACLTCNRSKNRSTLLAFARRAPRN